MTRIQKKRLFTIMILVIGVAVLLPVVFGEPRSVPGQTGGDSWRNFVYDFQTLITGVLAIGAAYFTIKSGQKIDARQQIRHEEILELQMRPDKLRVARAHVLFQSVEQNRRTFKNCSIPRTCQPLNPEEDYVMEVAVISVTCTMMLSALKNGSFDEIRELFDGDLQTKFERLRYHLEEFLKKVVLIAVPDGRELEYEYLPGVSQKVMMTTEYREMIRTDAVTRLKNTKAHLESFEVGFEKLSRLYKVV